MSGGAGGAARARCAQPSVDPRARETAARLSRPALSAASRPLLPPLLPALLPGPRAKRRRRLPRRLSARLAPSPHRGARVPSRRRRRLPSPLASPAASPSLPDRPAAARRARRAHRPPPLPSQAAEPRGVPRDLPAAEQPGQRRVSRPAENRIGGVGAVGRGGSRGESRPPAAGGSGLQTGASGEWGGSVRTVRGPAVMSTGDSGVGGRGALHVLPLGRA